MRRSYIGESYAGDSKYRDAAGAYEKVIRDYPASNILPEAWYKVGISYDRLGQPDKAREAFDYVVKNFPDTDAGRIAKQNLDRLNRAHADGIVRRAAARRGRLRWAA